MFRILIDTQVRENYGAHTWDGKGECPQRWKNKFGHTYCVGRLSMAGAAKIMAAGNMKAYVDSLVEKFKAKMFEDNHYYEEYMIGWDWANGETSWEKMYREHGDKSPTINLA